MLCGHKWLQETCFQSGSRGHPATSARQGEKGSPEWWPRKPGGGDLLHPAGSTPICKPRRGRQTWDLGPEPLLFLSSLSRRLALFWDPLGRRTSRCR